MKWILLCLLMISMQHSFAQTHMDTLIRTKYDARGKRNGEISAYVDSVNRYKGGQLPNFLLDECLDWKRSYWPDLHSAISVRWVILQKVNNKLALKRILNTNNVRLKQKCSQTSVNGFPTLTVPMIKESFYQLIEKRYQELER